MTKPKAPVTKVQTVRLPLTLLKLMKQLGQVDYRALNAQIQMMLEDWLIERGHMKDSQRRKF